MFFSGGSQGGDNVALTMGASMSGLGENPCPCCELTLMQRLTGFASCFGIGMLFSFLSTMSLWSSNYTQFAVLYSVGNTIALLSMGFLMGASFFLAPGTLCYTFWPLQAFFFPPSHTLPASYDSHAAFSLSLTHTIRAPCQNTCMALLAPPILFCHRQAPSPSARTCLQRPGA